MKLVYNLGFAIILGSSSCVFDRNATKSGSKEVPPWGDTRVHGEIWKEGRPIKKNPSVATMDEVFIDLGFYEADRDTMDALIRRGSRDGLYVVTSNSFFYRGSGSDPKLEIFRSEKDGIIVLEVYVANFQGFDDSVVWRYKIRYLVGLKRWVFDEVEGVRGHQWSH